MKTARRANYGIDAPDVVRTFLAIAVAAFAIGLLVDRSPNPGVESFIWPAWSIAICFAAIAVVMLLGSLVFKKWLRDKLLDALNLSGSERVLDVGCGSGLMLVGAAKRLNAGGSAVGIDLWKSVDQSGNDPTRTLANAAAEGMTERIEIVTGDFSQIPFPDGSFDVVVSSWAIHNPKFQDVRRKAIDEIVRVLRPGGKLVIADISCVPEYAKRLKELGASDVKTSSPNFLFVTPTLTVTAKKP
ncbi:MAG TPA: methyltransferase domain-containing protein [Candidatus Baltobacteraceae bacterium]